MKRLRTLSWMSLEQLERLVSGAEALRIRRPNTIFSEGQSSNRVYVMLSGVAKLSIGRFRIVTARPCSINSRPV